MTNKVKHTINISKTDRVAGIRVIGGYLETTLEIASFKLFDGDRNKLRSIHEDLTNHLSCYLAHTEICNELENLLGEKYSTHVHSICRSLNICIIDVYPLDVIKVDVMALLNIPGGVHG